MKTHWRNELDNPHLGHWDLEEDGKYLKYEVTIEGFSQGEITGNNGKETKSFVKLKEFSKKMVCNVTNFERLEQRFGNFDRNSWIGEKVILGVEKVSVGRKKRDALRFSVRPPAPPKKSELSNERLKVAIEKGYTFEQLLKDYAITTEQWTSVSGN